MTKYPHLFVHRLVIYLIILVGLAVYGNAVGNGFVGDDRYQLIDNPLMHSLHNIPTFFTGSTYFNGNPENLAGVYYRPLMVTFYSFLYTLHGPDPHIFHLFQLLLHILNAILVYWLLKKFFNTLLSSFLALIFLVHPQNNEAVVYIANLQDTLFLFFGLCGFLFLLYRPQKNLIVTCFFFLSLLSKESGLLFLGLGSLYTFFFQKKIFSAFGWQMMILLAFYLILRFFIAHIGFSYIPLAPITIASNTERLLTIPAIIFFYLQTFFFPVTISALHFWVIKVPDFSHFYLPLLSLMLTTTALFVFGKKLALHDIRRAKIFCFFCCWLSAGILLHLHLITVLDATAADRWFYFSSIGMLGLIGVILESIQITSFSVKRITVLAILLLVLLSLRTIIRNLDWYDTITLYEHDLPSSTPNFLSNNALGTEYLTMGDYEKAKPLIDASVKEYPYFANLNNAAVLALHEKKIPRAKRYLQEAVSKSKNYQVYENYSNFLVRYGTKQEAKDFSEAALHKFPQSQKLQKNLDALLSK